MEFTADHFSLLGLPPAFAVDSELLDANYRRLQADVHPDRFANASEADRRRSVQWSSRVNEAYETLRRPLSRALYLLSLAGVDVAAEKNTAMPAEFLMEQMSLREALDDARSAGDVAALEALHASLSEALVQGYERIGSLLGAEGDLPLAAETARKQMFLERFAEQIEDALAECE